MLVREPAYDDGEVLTPGCVADVFGVSTRTLRRWAGAGGLPSFRTPGGQRRFRVGRDPARGRLTAASVVAGVLHTRRTIILRTEGEWVALTTHSAQRLVVPLPW